MLDFVRSVGILVELAEVRDGFLPGIAVRHGRLIVDPERLGFPGDLLHDAGHIAVSDPAQRATMMAVADDPAEEMAAIAWSYAAALAAGINPRLVFHDHGYRGGGANLLENFQAGRFVGVPMLVWFASIASGEA